MVLRVRDGVVRRCGGDEVCGNELGALVHELVEGVLAICAGGTPDDGLFGEERLVRSSNVEETTSSHQFDSQHVDHP